MKKKLAKVINEKSEYYGGCYEIIDVLYTFKKTKKLYKLYVDGELLIFDSLNLEIL